MKKLILPVLIFAALVTQAAGYFGIKPIVNQPNCYGASNGSINLSIVGGTPSYTYAWSGGLAPTATQSNLPAGTYSVTVTDANGLTADYTLVVAQPFEMDPQLLYHISGHNQNNGELTALCGGGTPNYTYAWNTGANTQTISNLSPGTYTCTITDEVGCTTTVTDVIHAAPPRHFNGPAFEQGNERSLGAGNTGGDNGAQAANGKELTAETAPLKSEDVQLYPNPASNLLNLVTGEVREAQITVLDIAGQPVLTQNTQSNQTGINVSCLAKGNYIVEIRTPNGEVVSKPVTIVR